MIMSLAALFANSFNKWGCDIDQILLHGDNFSSVCSVEVMCQAKNLLFGVNCRL